MDPLPVVLSDPIVVRDGVLQVRRSENDPELLIGPLLSSSGEKMAEFVPGWTAHTLYSGLAPFLILEFRSASGVRAAWLLDPALRRLGDRLDDLRLEHRVALHAAAAPLLRRMVVDILLRPLPVLSREAQGFSHLNDVLRTAIAEWDLASVLPPPDAVFPASLPEFIPLPESIAAFAMSGVSPAALSRAWIEAGFQVALEDRLVAATLDGMLSWPSPIDGRMLRCQGSIYFDDFRFAYRFADIESGLTFYVIAADHYCKAMALYVPALDLLVVRDDRCRHLLDVYFPPNLARWFVNQAALNGPLLVPYLVRGAQRISSIMRGRPGTHMGHQLWNELSGMEYLLTGAQGDRIPEWIVPGAKDGIELWGPIEQIFPELRQRVNRSLPSGADMMPVIYRERICAVRITREHVSAELRRRLQRITQMDPVYPEIRAQVVGARAQGAPVLVLGLRVENRTLVDITAFFRDAIRLIAQVWPGAIVVIDGHNARPGGGEGAVIESHGEQMATQSPLARECEIAAELRAASAGLDIRIVDTLGAGMASSLAWALLSDGFLSVWGASLAKFRWVCNKPGMVVSSQANLLHRDDLHIYDSPRYMENPAPLLFADPASVTDEPDAPRLVPVSIGNPFFANFRVDHGRVLTQFRAMVSELLAARNPH